MKKTRRTTTELSKIVKDAKKQKLSIHAQRKFASSYPSSPSQKETVYLPKQGFPKTEDFIEFLCVRNSPSVLPSDLEIFAEPLVVPRHTVSEKDVFELSDFTDEPECFIDNTEDSSQNSVTSEFLGTDKSNECSPVEMINVHHKKAKLKEMRDFSLLLKKVNHSSNAVSLILPPEDWIAPQYVQDDFKFQVRIKHIHRLKHSLCDNYVRLLCIKRQLEHESNTTLDDVPQIGLCELDLPLLYETVNAFGGLETVNSEQSWKAIADYLQIPKTASRRVSKLEEVYLKYLLTYDLLSEDDKVNLMARVKNDRHSESAFLSPSNMNGKPMSLVTFHRMVCNSQVLWKQNGIGVEEIEKNFWEVVNNGNKHIAAASGCIDLTTNPQSYQRTKNKPPWNLQNLFSINDSALKYLGKVSGISFPNLLVEGLFSCSEWCTEQHGFNTMSYMHSGSEKIWYVIPKEQRALFQSLRRESETVITPTELLSRGCQVYRCVQKEGEYVVLQPGCYYWTVSTGYSCSEVVCFATMDWFSSPDAICYQLRLSDFVRLKLVLVLATEESKKSTKSTYSEFLTSKLTDITSILIRNLKLLRNSGITNTTCLKLKTADVRNCKMCRCYCYLLRVVAEDDTVYCVNDALRMVTKKKLVPTDLCVEYVVSVETNNSVLKKLSK